MKNVQDRVFDFLKKNKRYAYRPTEIIKKLKAGDSGVMSGLRFLLEKKKIGRKRVESKCSYYFYLPKRK